MIWKEDDDNDEEKKKARKIVPSASLTCVAGLCFAFASLMLHVRYVTF